MDLLKFYSTVEPGFRNQSRSPWLKFLNPGSALNPCNLYHKTRFGYQYVLSALNQGSTLNPRFLNSGSTVIGKDIGILFSFPLRLVQLPYKGQCASQNVLFHIVHSVSMWLITLKTMGKSIKTAQNWCQNLVYILCQWKAVVPSLLLTRRQRNSKDTLACCFGFAQYIPSSQC